MAEIEAVTWVAETSTVRLLDQTRLPGETAHLECATVADVIDAVKRLAVRGAPALGAVGAYGVAVALAEVERSGAGDDVRDRLIADLRAARPTAVNLAVGVDRARAEISNGRDAVVAAADQLVAEDQAANRQLAEHGADWIEQRVERRPLRILTHCNTGALATTGWGTAFGIIRTLFERGNVEQVYADESRPLLQGSRLTAYELGELGIPHVVQADGAAASTILRGLVDVAVIGADRIADNGDTANKIGSVSVALACADAGIPFVVAAPTTTVDLATATGDDIEIELRDGAEVTTLAGVATAPAASAGFNPAFDVTPARMISAIVTEQGVVEPTPSTSMKNELST